MASCIFCLFVNCFQSMTNRMVFSVSNICTIFLRFVVTPLSHMAERSQPRYVLHIPQLHNQGVCNPLVVVGCCPPSLFNFCCNLNQAVFCVIFITLSIHSLLCGMGFVTVRLFGYIALSFVFYAVFLFFSFFLNIVDLNIWLAMRYGLCPCWRSFGQIEKKNCSQLFSFVFIVC